MSNYPPNEIVDIFLILGECHRNYCTDVRHASMLNGIRYSTDP